MKRFLSLSSKTVVALALVIAATACTKKSKEQEGELGLALNETIRVNIETEPPSLDWHKGTDTTSSRMTGNIMDGLTAFNTADPELSTIPKLALSWEPTEGAKVWTFKLRPGVKWTDGQDFTAQNVVDAWERLLNPTTAAEYAYFLFNIKNAKEYNEKKVTDFSQVGVKVIDPMTLQVTLSTPISFFPSLLTHHSTFPIRKDIVAKYGDKWTDPDKIVTLGEYKLKTWEHDKHLILERNEGYYGEKAKTKYVLCRIIKEQATAISLFESGKIDALLQLPSTEYAKLRNKPEWASKGILSSYFYGMNVKKAPFNNADFRKAFAYAIDRNEIVTMLGGGEVPMASWVPNGMFGHEPTMGLMFDAAKAKEFMKKAGYTDPKKVPKITLAFNTNENHKRIAENVQAQIKRNLGIEIELKNEEWKVYLSNLRTDAPQMYRMGWVADYPDPDNFMTLMTSGSENNRTGWKNEKYDKLVAQGAVETDKTKRKEIYAQAQKILVEEDVPAIPIYTAAIHYFIAPRIRGTFPVNPLDETDFSHVEVATAADAAASSQK